MAYVVPADTPAPSAATLRAELDARLPRYMVPSAFVALSALPLTETGKVDRLALPAPGRARSLPLPPVPPGTPLEQALAAIWADVLELDVVGIDDDFLALGGNSLLAMQILASIDGVFGAGIPPSAMFAASTVGKMAALVRERTLGLTVEAGRPEGEEHRPSGR